MNKDSISRHKMVIGRLSLVVGACLPVCLLLIEYQPNHDDDPPTAPRPPPKLSQMTTQDPVESLNSLRE
jgi:hypothetical protein